ncbi:MAG: signal recognition particle protein [Thermoprotei archaeon]|nr:MAG: signal recognition particle protein [Thermoprotei archaeon]
MEQFREGLLKVVSRIRTSVMLDKKEVDAIIRELQRVLLKADVDVKLVFEITQNIKKKFFSQQLPPGFSKKEVLLKILYDELVRLLGGEETYEFVVDKRPKIVMLVGIQGSGKTTSTAKLASYLQKRGYRVGVICADTYRPGAYDQLKQLSEKIGVIFYGDPREKNAVKIVKDGVGFLKNKGVDVILIDTAGRHKDEISLINEMKEISDKIKPDETILVIDSTIGKAAGKQAEAFHKVSPIGSIILTKLDGTAKGGGALSAVSATGAKIAFIGVGEKIDDLELFNARKFVARLLGMPDLENIIKRFERLERIERERAKAIAAGKLTLLDLKDQLKQISSMGPLSKILEMFGGMPSLPEGVAKKGEENISKWLAIMDSMTMEELLHPEILDKSRINRIARGSGTTPRDVRELLAAYKKMKKLMRQFARSRKKLPGLRI